MDQAWQRYKNEPEVLMGLVIELGLEAMRARELAEWCDQQIREINAHLQEAA